MLEVSSKMPQRVRGSCARVAEGAAGEVKGGGFASRSAGKPFAYAERAPSAFVAALPRDFMDPLPLRAARFATAREPVPDREATYSEVQAWLSGPYRIAFVKRFEPKLADPNFRVRNFALGCFHPQQLDGAKRAFIKRDRRRAVA